MYGYRYGIKKARIKLSASSVQSSKMRQNWPEVRFLLKGVKKLASSICLIFMMMLLIRTVHMPQAM
ncbi:hypothetical protein D3C71_1277290 [compost metagenome]